MTCDGDDVIAKSIYVPDNIQTNDWLCFGGMGCYTNSMKSKFNGMESTCNIYTWESDIL